LLAKLKCQQKQALFKLLKMRFSTAQREAKFPWLVVPKMDAMDGPIAAIYEALVAMRGFSTFATAGYSLKCDFYLPSQQLIVEYDERQHFMLQRAKALELYPADLSVGFDRQEWITECNSLQANDPTPPYRDEQRSFYDSLRDVLSIRNGHRIADFARQSSIGQLRTLRRS
jgi:hypothetical protein